MLKLFRHNRYVVKRFKEAIGDDSVAYPFVRWTIADAKCYVAVNKGTKAFRDLVKWQDIREKYFKRIITLRPRNNEFFSY